MARSKSSSGIVTAPLPDSDVLWLDLVFQMDKLNWAMRRLDALINGNPASRVGQNPGFRSGGAFGLEVIAAKCEVLEAARKELGDDIGHSEVPREVIARRIITVAKLGDRDPVRLQAAALRKPDQPTTPSSRLSAREPVAVHGRLSFTRKDTPWSRRTRPTALRQL